MKSVVSAAVWFHTAAFAMQNSVSAEGDPYKAFPF